MSCLHLRVLYFDIYFLYVHMYIYTHIYIYIYIYIYILIRERKSEEQTKQRLGSLIRKFIRYYPLFEVDEERKNRA